MKKIVTNLFTALCILSIASPCFGLGANPGLTFKSKMVAKAPIDECYNGIGQPYKAGPNCDAGEIPKSNESYLWGLTKAGDKLWFGTGANMICLMGANRNFNAGEEGSAYENSLWVCEFGQGQYIPTQMSVEAPSVFGDYRPPKIYTYNIADKSLTDVTAQITDTGAQQLIQHTFGIRSAATMGNLIFLGGPMALDDGINIFVFNADTGALVGARTLTQYQNIRKWLVLNGQLYAAVADESGGGKILRWTGSSAAPFSFEEVGAVDGSATEIAAHNGRIFVGTWPNRKEEDPALAGLWMSPAVPTGGLTPAHLNAWNKVWAADEYEPDSVIVRTYGCGPMISYGGYLYWGTMHVAFPAAALINATYGLGTVKYPYTFLKTWRATVLFRGTDFDTDKQVDLLYGDNILPVYDGQRWVNRPNNMGGVAGMYGKPGFGNMFNNYTWSMAVYEGNLFVGTMDEGYVGLDWDNMGGYYGEEGTYFGMPRLFDFLPTPVEGEYGADLWRFPSPNDAAVRFDRAGLGNFSNYGFRTTVVDTTGLYIGTANPSNILMDDDGNSLSGWELHRVNLE